MLAEAACTSLGCTSKTRSPHAHVIQHVASVCHVLFGRPHTLPPLLAYPAAKTDSVGYPENSQPVKFSHYHTVSSCLSAAKTSAVVPVLA